MQEKKEIVFTVPGEPRPKGRPRFTRQGFAYTPKETREYEEHVRECYKQAIGGKEILAFEKGVAICMEFEFFLPIPKSWSEEKKQLARFGELYPAGRPDLDNLVKAISDALNGVAFYDDSQIISFYAEKRYETEAGVRIHICER